MILPMRVFILMLLLVIGCAESPDPKTSASSKPLFSAWQGPNFTIDVSGGDFGWNNIRFNQADGSYCDGEISFVGTETQGIFVITNQGGFSPDCMMYSIRADYTKTGDILTVCNQKTSVCTTFY